MRNGKTIFQQATPIGAKPAPRDQAPSAQDLVAEIFKQQLQIAIATSIRSANLRTQLAHRKITAGALQQAQIEECVADTLARAATLCAEQWLALLPASEQPEILARLTAAPPVLPVLVAAKIAVVTEAAAAPVAATVAVVAPTIAEPTIEIADEVAEPAIEIAAEPAIEIAAEPAIEMTSDLVTDLATIEAEPEPNVEAGTVPLAPATPELDTILEPVAELIESARGDAVRDAGEISEPTTDLAAEIAETTDSEPFELPNADTSDFIGPVLVTSLADANEISAPITPEVVSFEDAQAGKPDASNTIGTSATLAKQQAKPQQKLQSEPAKPARRRFGFLRLSA